VPLVCKYIALYVPDLRAAEDFYGRAFGMEVLLRETERGGEWWTLPTDRSWDDALAAGVELHMVAMRRDDLVLALFRGAPAPGTVHEVCLGLAAHEIDRIRERPPDGCDVIEHRDGFVRFDDPFGFGWVLQTSTCRSGAAARLRGAGSRSDHG
jgi:catechol 2,3-dioxygenase-like lactoylglutathione lyase family enzyme